MVLWIIGTQITIVGIDTNEYHERGHAKHFFIRDDKALRLFTKGQIMIGETLNLIEKVL